MHGHFLFPTKKVPEAKYRTVCAVYTNDEETCVSTARQLMRESSSSDAYRVFGLLSKLCQSPISWYTSGPAQKYILRQIKAIDQLHESLFASNSVDIKPGGARSANISIDVCLLMLYGHILFTSRSYTYAIGKMSSLSQIVISTL